MKTSYPKRFPFHIIASVCIIAALICTLVFSVGCTHDLPSSEEAPSSTAFGRITEYSTYAKGEALTDTFYYDEAWFGEDPKKRNDSLALLSMQLSAAAVTDEADGNGARALRSLGFDRVGFVGFETSDPDDCAYTWATKKIGDQTLVAIVLQSYAFDSATKTKGWTQNFHVNDDGAVGEHAAFRKAAEKTLDGIAALGGENAKYWIMGQSRAGAIANLIAAKLPDKIRNAQDKIYAYTFEAPATVDGSLAQEKNKSFAYIQNYVSSDDIVPMVPMWGMTRYGNHYEVKSEATELALSAELKKIGSSAADVDFGDNEDKLSSLVAYLENRLSAGEVSREDYSKLRRDVCTDRNGKSLTIEYSYQETMKRLMNLIFSGELAKINVDNLSEDLSVFASSVYALADAVKGEADGDPVTIATDYYQAAQGLHEVINGLIPNGSTILTDTDYYALLRLAGPLMLDVDYEPEGDPKYDVSRYIYPTIDLATAFGNLSYAHHFDTVIARLKTLAPQPNATSFDLSLTQPKAGDAVSAMSTAFTEKVKSSEASGITVLKAGWNTAEAFLQSGSVYYFDVTAEVIGHLLPEDFKITIDNKDPIDVSSEYMDGVCVVKLRWEFVFGTPERMTLTFEGGHGSTSPTPISVEKGKKLKYETGPSFVSSISEGGKRYLFDRWESDDGTRWDDITVSRDMTLHAHWIQLIDEMQITFDAPSVGEELQLPSIPEDAPYQLTEYNLSDEEYFPIEAEEFTAQAGVYHINLFFTAIEGEALFAEETISYDDYEEKTYLGTIKLNGEPYDDYYYDTSEVPAQICVSITFSVE